MKLGVFLTFTLAVFSAQYNAQELLDTCKDNKGTPHKLNDSYIGEDNCNTCICLPMGSSCHKMLCPRDASPRTAEAGKCVDSAGVLYDKGQSYTHVDGCNTCRCTEHGGACTRMFCIQREEKEVALCRDPRGTEMKVGDSWLAKDGCNKCLCGALGAVCTERYCGHHKQFEDGDAQIEEFIHTDDGSYVDESGDQPCRDHNNKLRNPGDTWLTEDSCNVCSCKGDGNVPSCTKMGCRVRLARLLKTPDNSARSTTGTVLLTLLPLVTIKLLA